MIKISCHSNEDILRIVEWPMELNIRPMIGEYISSLDRKHSRKIVRIEHFFVRSTRDDTRDFSYLSLELSK